MRIIVDVIDIFPKHGVLAVCSVELNNLLTMFDVKLKLDYDTEEYLVEYPSTGDGQTIVEICDKELNKKVLDAMVSEYESYIMSLIFDSDYDNFTESIPYMYRIERGRIEHNFLTKLE